MKNSWMSLVLLMGLMSNASFAEEAATPAPLPQATASQTNLPLPAPTPAADNAVEDSTGQVIGEELHFFFTANLGGAFNLNNTPGSNVEFDYGGKFGAVVGHISASQLALTIGFDRLSISGRGTVNNGGILHSNVPITEAYHDTCLQILLMNIAGSGLYIGPNVGMANITENYDLGSNNPGVNNSFFVEMGATTGYEFYLGRHFAIGPDVRLEHIFSEGTDVTFLKFTANAAVHF